MRLFKRGRAKSEPHPSADESQRSWGVFRLFQNNCGSLMSKEPAAPTASICLLDNQNSKLTTDSSGNCSPVNCKFTNQNYTPEVALSPESVQLLHLRPANAICTAEHSEYTESHNTTCLAPEKLATDPRAHDLQRFEAWQERKPRFHLGPRQPEEENGAAGDSSKRGSVCDSTVATDNIISLPNKFAFIYQDGKFVEREVTRWPKQQRALPHQRYRVMEPYATRYGRRYRKRISSQERIVTQRYRLIYQNPIYMLPRKMMEENKTRLIMRHSLKDSFEGAKVTPMPQKIDVGEQAQNKMIRKNMERHNTKQADILVNYITAAKTKARQGKS